MTLDQVEVVRSRGAGGVTPVLVALGGAAGSILRYLTDRRVQRGGTRRSRSGR